MDTRSPSLISVSNSSVIALLGGGIFTGAFEDISNFNTVSIHVFSDKDSAIDGLSFQWSTDGTEVGNRIESTSVLANKARAFSLSVRSRYFRIKYTNGSIAQSTFKLLVIYYKGGSGLITKPLDGEVTGENFAQLVQAPVMARLSNDVYANIAGVKLDSTALLGVADATAVMANQGFSFKVSTNRLSTASVAEIPYLLIDNPAGSGKIIRFDKFIFLGPIDTDGNVTYRIYMGPTTTANGTLLTEIGNRQTGQVVGAGNFYTLPTVSANGSLIFLVSISGSAPPFDYDLEHGTLIEPGFKMLVTATQTKTSDAGAINVEYSESVL